MGCKIAENEPLKRLRMDIGLPLQCHSLREDCIHKLQRADGNGTMGIPGAAIGYCQALFRKTTSSEDNTRKIIKNLQEIKAPWHLSHELFWGDKGSEPLEEFLTNSMLPLIGNGRIPILITPLNLDTDYEVIKEVLTVYPKVLNNETILLRVIISNKQSIDNAVKIIKAQVAEANLNKEMPKWWLLLQGDMDMSLWNYLRSQLAENWQYSNLAVNPFTVDNLPDFCWEQVTVGQVVIGHKEGVNNTGEISLPSGMKISGAKELDKYNLYDYFKKLSVLNTSPTLIVLGPSLPEWSDEYNQERLNVLMPVFKDALPILWNDLHTSRVNMVLSLTA